ncbi:helix-turn-helix domain-containing protein [Ferrovibrio sp.]|uniref:helix-turn-helix domain-containing protein n=1 Tax=Ferrovibrio sp. TaxID=1917215 RepID=UPI0035AEA89D
MAFPSGEMDRAAGGADRIPVVRFTTAGLPAGDRFAAWSRATSALFDLCAPHPRRGMAGFSASLTAYHFGAFLLCHSRADAARYVRSAQRSRLDDLDHYLIHLPLQQAGGFSGGFGGGVVRRLRPMDVGIFDLALPSAYIAGAGETISLIVPRAGLSLLLRNPDQQHGRILRRDQPMGAMLAQHLIALNSVAPRFGLHEAMALANTVLGLIAVCLGFDMPSTARAPPSQQATKEPVARRIRAYIEQNLHRETLTPELIVKELAISRSQLYRQFEAFGGVRHYVRRRRLRQSLLAICNPLQSGQRIADIAYEKGFSDEAHFSRLFRDAFGLSPREARQAVQRGDAALLAAVLPPTSAAAAGEQAPFTHWIRELAIA